MDTLQFYNILLYPWLLLFAQSYALLIILNQHYANFSRALDLKGHVPFFRMLLRFTISLLLSFTQLKCVHVVCLWNDLYLVFAIIENRETMQRNIIKMVNSWAGYSKLCTLVIYYYSEPLKVNDISKNDQSSLDNGNKCRFDGITYNSFNSVQQRFTI